MRQMRAYGPHYKEDGRRMGQLNGKVAIVTGSGRGIGKAIAKLFAAEGAKVGVVSRTRANIEHTVAEIEAQGGVAIGVPCDVTRREEIYAAVDTVSGHFGTIDILVNNAHDIGDVRHDFMDTQDELFRSQFDCGLMGTVHFMQAAFPYLKDRRGKVINFASSVGIVGQSQYAAYAASKEAIRAVSRVAAREWARLGVNVNIVCPVAATDAMSEALKNPEVAAAIAQMPFGRAGDPEEDIAPVVLFLATEASRYITGHSFMVDGGSSMDAGR
jgi:3-oxoacyl-[acyl-carrier protein] reductase